MSHINYHDEKTPHIKRLLEQYVGDHNFRNNYTKGQVLPHPSILNVDKEATRSLWDSSFIRSENYKDDAATENFKAFNTQKVSWRNYVRQSCSPDHPIFKKWRQRQMNRATLQLGAHLNDRLIHTPIMFELSDGCSVGCSFCAFKAKKLCNVFSYTEANEKLWKDVLCSVKKYLGSSANWGACYFATDPFDNPDYEKFCLDYVSIIGAFPQTTTALSTQNIARTKALIKLSRLHHGEIDRFSVLSLSTLYKIFDSFTPEELIYVELMLQNKESLLLKSASGKYLDQINQDEKLKSQSPLMGKTISCLTGFMVNMCNKTCKLIAPCPADEKWPLGYMVFKELHFDTGDDFERCLHDFIHEDMTVHVTDLKTLQLRDHLSISHVGTHFEISDTYHKLTLSCAKDGQDYMHKLLRYAKEASHHPKTIAMLLFYEYQVKEQVTLDTLDYLFRQGIFKEMN